MQPKLFWCYVLSAVFILKGSRVSSDSDEYETRTTVTSLTGSKTPFAYIETNCITGDTSTCRSFSCSAFSSSTPTIFWSLKRGQNGDWEQIQKNSSSKEIGLQLISEIVLVPQQFGYLRCFVNNTHGNTEVIKEVVPYNNTGQRFIQLKEGEFQFSIVNENHAEFYWYLVLLGYPRPTLHLEADGVQIDSKISPKYNVTYKNLPNITDGIVIKLKVMNASESDLQTTFILHAENIYENVSYVLDFDAREMKKLDIDMSFLDETHISVNCTASSLLPTEINCQFKPCLDDKCMPEYLPVVESYETNLQHTISLNLNSSMVGILQCFANNSVSVLYKKHMIYGMDKTLDIMATVPVTEIDKQRKRIEIDPLQSVILTCVASSFSHEKNITWAYPTLHKQYTEYGIGRFIDAAFTYQLPLTLTRWNAENRTFYCKSFLKNGTLEYVQIEIAFKGIREWTYYVIAILLLIMMGILIFVLLKMKRYQKIRKQIKDLNLIDLANFEKGALEHLNPNLPIDDQADLLPYNKRYEFPIERLKLGEQIGSGAFGVVLKGEAKGVFESEPSTTVAVKMVNRNIGDVYIKALASELKIMIHLGKHVNVVNLLGACTKNITKRELLVIVEYCRFGNLKDYLLNHRHSFIDQINKETEQIDFTIGSDVLGDKDSEFPYITPSFTNFNYTRLYGTIQEAKEEDINGDSSEAPKTDQEYHYKGDYRSINKPVCTRDLLLWSFQIARGMEYLSSRKVLHGDLAARNILLTDGNVVKICDFGLARKMYQKDIYKKAGDEMLPVKWMAIEAITDKIFSIQSDVWSFGVVLWEIFSLARTPYPGMEFNEHFCEKLLEGYRMKSPQFATQEIYEIMLDCWNAEAILRPSFTQLVQTIGNILDEKLREHYIDMNAGYLKMNARRIQEESVDYLSMVGAPDFKKYSSFSGYANVASKVDDETNTYL